MFFKKPIPCVITHSSSVLVPWYRLQIRFRIRIRFLDPQYLRFEFDLLSRTTWLFVSFSFRIENRNEFPSLNYTFMGIFGTHIGISRITFSEHKFRALSKLFRSPSITSRLVDGQKLRRLSWNGWKSVFSRGRSFSHFFHHFCSFSPCVFEIRAFHHDYVLFKGDWTTLQRRGSTEPNSLRYDPSKLAQKTFVCTSRRTWWQKKGTFLELLSVPD